MSTTEASSPGRTKYRFEDVAPDTLAGRFMRQFWQPISLASAIEPGKARPVHAFGESFTLYRTEDGAVHLTEFRCPHRRTQLSTGWVEPDGIRCMYHGWKFGTDGQCKEVPGEDNANYIKRISLKTYPVQEYLGLIFAWLGGGEPPAMPRYTAFEKAGYLDVTTYFRDCNHFQNIENGIDEVHVNFTHSVGVFGTSGLNEEVPQVQAEQTSYGLVAKGIRSDGRVRDTQFLMPNILMLKLPATAEGETDWRNYISWRIPVTETLHMAFIVQGIAVSGDDIGKFVAAREAEAAEIAKLPSFKEVSLKVMAGEISMTDVPLRPDITGIQDYVTQVGQGEIVDRSQEHLGRSDIAIVLLRRLWENELRLLEQGQPLTQWRVPDMLAPSKGL
ncbi:Rieske 2Fe-2S domain-containing protein [Brevundimonas guildfordensis]|uniref:Rieske 2Fe-2S domain-containing protein n=1 Tax=Brevundimonas guildfordensis TaxID=2762241 RepID=A0ABR8QWN9_9CAUL|nr:Rieske 2Fe-2S domain-containing protein [Brevundimonas guildfordensis]MBD7939948.1 Rieske 2Fe-2S domain-containing protein [Brevundimonas guildfordensis]